MRVRERRSERGGGGKGTERVWEHTDLSREVHSDFRSWNQSSVDTATHIMCTYMYVHVLGHYN